MNYDYDVDWFRFNAAEQTMYDVAVQALPGFSMLAKVYRPGGTSSYDWTWVDESDG